MMNDKARKRNPDPYRYDIVDLRVFLFLGLLIGWGIGFIMAAISYGVK